MTQTNAQASLETLLWVQTTPQHFPNIIQNWRKFIEKVPDTSGKFQSNCYSVLFFFFLPSRFEIRSRTIELIFFNFSFIVYDVNFLYSCSEARDSIVGIRLGTATTT
jgi:hypothetical protein